MDIDAIHKALSSCALAEGLDTRILRLLAGIATVQDYQPGQRVVAAGEPCDGLYVVVCGTARVDSSFGGTTRSVASLAPCDLFGEVALVGHQPRSSSVFALDPLTCVILPVNPLYQLMEAHPALAERLEQLAQARLESNLSKHLEQG